MGFLERVIEAIFALFIIVIFASIIIPALGEATGTNMAFGVIVFILLAIAIIAGLFKGIMR